MRRKHREMSAAVVPRPLKRPMFRRIVARPRSRKSAPKGQHGTPSHIPVSYLSSDDARVASDRGPASSRCPRVCRGGMFTVRAWRSCGPAAWTAWNVCSRDRSGSTRAATHPDSTEEARYATVVWPISVTRPGRIEASQDSPTEEGDDDADTGTLDRRDGAGATGRSTCGGIIQRADDRRGRSSPSRTRPSRSSAITPSSATPSRARPHATAKPTRSRSASSWSGTRQTGIGSCWPGKP